MEFEEAQKLWKEQNGKLDKSITLSEQLLKNIFTQKANGVIETWLKWDYFSLIEFVVFLVFMSISTYKFMDDWIFLLSGIFIIGFLTACVIQASISIKQLNTISIFSQSVIDVKRSILNYKKRINQYMKILWFIIPPIVITFLLLGVRFRRNINLFDYPDFFVPLAIGIVTISYVIAFVSYQTIYARKFKIIENNLMELEKFKEE